MKQPEKPKETVAVQEEPQIMVKEEVKETPYVPYVLSDKERIGKVIVKPVNKALPNVVKISTVGKEGDLNSLVLPNSRSKYMPVLDRSKNFPGMSRKEFEFLKTELGLEKEMTYDKFWGTSSYVQVTLTDRPLLLNKEVLTDYVKYLVLANHPWVASDASKIEKGHIYYMTDEEKEAVQYLNKAEIKMKAISLISNMGPDERRKMLFWAFGIPGALDTSDAKVSQQLLQRVENDPEQFLKLYDKPFKEERIILAEAVNYKVVQKSNSAYSFNETVLGIGEDDAVVFLSNAVNQRLFVTIQKELEVAKRKYSITQ